MVGVGGMRKDPSRHLTGRLHGPATGTRDRRLRVPGLATRSSLLSTHVLLPSRSRVKFQKPSNEVEVPGLTEVDVLPLLLKPPDTTTEPSFVTWVVDRVFSELGHSGAEEGRFCLVVLFRKPYKVNIHYLFGWV